MLYLELIVQVAQLVHALLVKAGMVWLMADVMRVLILIHSVINAQVQVVQGAIVGIV